MRKTCFLILGSDPLYPFSGLDIPVVVNDQYWMVQMRSGCSSGVAVGLQDSCSEQNAVDLSKRVLESDLYASVGTVDGSDDDYADECLWAQTYFGRIEVEALEQSRYFVSLVQLHLIQNYDFFAYFAQSKPKQLPVLSKSPGMLMTALLILPLRQQRQSHDFLNMSQVKIVANQ